MIIIIYIIILTVILMNTPIQIQYPKIIIPQEQNRNMISNYIPQITNPNSAFIPYNNIHNNFHQRILFPDIFYLNTIFYQNFFFNQILKQENKKEEVENDNNLLLGKKKKRVEKLCTNCPHVYSRHYAKGMCSNCYHSKGRIKKPWNCPHVNKSHYALGLCQNCYQIAYIKKQSDIHSKKFVSFNLREEEKNIKEENDVNNK